MLIIQQIDKCSKQNPQILTTSDIRLLHANCLCTIGHGTGTERLFQAGVI